MIRYRYNHFNLPPAPWVNATLRRPKSGEPGLAAPAQIDTGADRTVIPTRLVLGLGLVEVRRISAMGLGGHLTFVTTYLVEIGIHESPTQIIEVMAHPDEPYCLLGRDILNGFKITLDGPRLTMQIE
ncbi:MAG TPA: retroviral-like aspartic protease family protein [Isosphaeraceae bacterium]